jgi:hypothetical protein
MIDGMARGCLGVASIAFALKALRLAAVYYYTLFTL